MLHSIPLSRFFIMFINAVCFMFLIIVDVIYQTRETVFHRDIQTPRRKLKIRRTAELFLTKFDVFDSR